MFGKRKKLIIQLKSQLLAIEKWNKSTFHDANLGGQLEKLEEELREFYKAENNEEATKELADIFIVLGGLIRFNSRIGIFFENCLLKSLKTKQIEVLINAVDEKMKINRSRKWHKTGNGKYHH